MLAQITCKNKPFRHERGQQNNLRGKVEPNSDNERPGVHSLAVIDFLNEVVIRQKRKQCLPPHADCTTVHKFGKRRL